MDEQNRELLDEEILRIQEKMKTLEIGTPEYTRAKDDLRDLLDTRQDDIKKEREFMAKCDEYTLELEDRKAKAKQEHIRNVIDCVKIGVELGVAAATLWLKTKLMHEGYKADETGGFRSAGFKDVISWALKTDR